MHFVAKVESMMMPTGEMMRLTAFCVQRMPERAQ